MILILYLVFSLNFILLYIFIFISHLLIPSDVTPFLRFLRNKLLASSRLKKILVM